MDVSKSLPPAYSNASLESQERNDEQKSRLKEVVDRQFEAIDQEIKDWNPHSVDNEGNPEIFSKMSNIYRGVFDPKIPALTDIIVDFMFEVASRAFAKQCSASCVTFNASHIKEFVQGTISPLDEEFFGRCVMNFVSTLNAPQGDFIVKT